MSLVSLAGIGMGLVLLSLVIYFATRKLVMRSMSKGASEPKVPLAEPMYETPMPKTKVIIAEEETATPEANPLLEFIEEWEEPKPPAQPRVKPEPQAKKAPKAEKMPQKTDVTKAEELDNPLLRYIEEWEEPKAKPKKK